MGIEERIRAARAFERSRFVAFEVDADPVGFVRRDLLEALRRFDDIFTIGEASLGFTPDVVDPENRSAAMAHVARELAAQGLLSPWRHETYDIGNGKDGRSLFTLERAAVRFFGFVAHAVHVNGLVADGHERSMWIARRSADKAIDPGMLDNMVGGGLASGLTIRDTVLKEAWEEAGIPAQLAATARSVGHLHIRREVPEGLHAEIIYLHDLLLPPEFTPVNQDGEVAQLRLTRFPAVLEAIERDARFTVDAALVALDCLVRHGALDAKWAPVIHAPIA
jgi:8-oxo-dGTP pyrophosphatase MutT (NUDIX family)